MSGSIRRRRWLMPPDAARSARWAWAVVALDRSALPDRAYRYRLVARDGGELTVLDPGILIEAGSRLAFALAAVGPSPGSGSVRIAFSLAHAAAIEIEVFDIQGRR